MAHRTAVLVLALFSALGLFLAVSPARSDDQTPPDLTIPEGMRRCEASAYLADQDMNGVAVRKGPGTSFAPITLLPAMRMKEKGGGLELYGADVDVVGTDGKGWFLIEGAQYDPDDDADGPPRKVRTFGDTGRVYGGRGWVHGSRLMTDIVTSRGLRSEPDPKARIVHPIDRPGYGPEIEATFLDCSGGAARLRARYEGRAIEGWMNTGSEDEKLCASQRTTCN